MCVASESQRRCSPTTYLLVLLEQLMPLEEVLVFQLLLQQLVSLLQVFLLHVPYRTLTLWSKLSRAFLKHSLKATSHKSDIVVFRCCTSDKLLLLVETFPLHLCNLSLVVGDDRLQCRVQAFLLSCQKGVLLSRRKEKDKDGGNVRIKETERGHLLPFDPTPHFEISVAALIWNGDKDKQTPCFLLICMCDEKFSGWDLPKKWWGHTTSESVLLLTLNP